MLRFAIAIGASLLVSVVSADAPSRGSTPQGQAHDRFYFNRPNGPHSVGVKAVQLRDLRRAETDAAGETPAARILPTLIWYPSEGSDGTRTTVDHYATMTREMSGARRSQGARDAELDAGLTSSKTDVLRAVKDAEPASGTFPIVVYAPGFASPAWENADLCEFLASHGYVVISTDSFGASGEMTEDLAGVDAQAKDISLLIGAAEKISAADLSRVAVAGFSWGNLSGLLAAARDNRIDALIALDGSMRYYPGLIAQSSEIDLSKMTIPLLYLAQRNYAPENIKSDLEIGPSVLNRWTRGDLIFVHMLRIVHQQFSSMLQRHESMWGNLTDFDKGEFTRHDGIVAYAWVAEYSRAFLDTYLKGDRAWATTFLRQSPAQNGIAPQTVAARVRNAN